MSRERSGGARIGLALAGGVIEGGFYEVGVLCALEDAIEGLDCTRADVYVGVSAGAVISSLLANGVSPRTLSRAILSRADPILNLNPDILFTPALGEYAARAGKVPGLLGRWLKRRIANPFDVSVAGWLLELGALAPVGFFDSEPMERYLARVFRTAGRTNDFRKLRTKLRIVAVKLDSAELVTFGDEGTEHVPVSRAVQASLSLPGFYCPVEIDGELYIDGVARRTLNASVALDEDMDLLFCVNPIVPVDLHAPGARGDTGAVLPVERGGGANGSGGGRSLVDYGLPGVLSQTFRTMIHSRMGTGMRNYAHAFPGADVVLIEPAPADHRMFFSNIFSFQNRREVCEHAYASTRRHLLARADEMEETLARRGLRLRREVLEDDSRTLFPEDILRERRVEPRREDLLEDIRRAVERLNHSLDRLDLPL